MKHKRLVVATALLAVVAAVTFLRLQDRRAEDAGENAATLHLPKIDAKEIDELELTPPNHPRVRLVKRRGEWRIIEPIGVAADPDVVSAALQQLAALRIDGVAATKAKHYERLGLQEREATHVVAKGERKTLIDAYIGEFQGGHTMLRLSGQGPVGRVPFAIRHLFNKGVDEWRDRTITKMDASTVQEIAFENTAGRFHFVRAGKGWEQRPTLGDRPIERLDLGKVSAAVSTATNLNADGFAPSGTTREAAGLNQNSATVWCKLRSGGELRYRVGRLEEDTKWYLELEGRDVIYKVTHWIGERFIPDADDLMQSSAPTTEGGSAKVVQNDTEAKQ